jgi:hypothetical protein
MSDDTKVAEAIMATVTASQADSDTSIVRALANVLVWQLRRMPKDTAKPALGYLFNVLTANGFIALTSSDTGHG